MKCDIKTLKMLRPDIEWIFKWVCEQKKQKGKTFPHVKQHIILQLNWKLKNQQIWRFVVFIRQWQWHSFIHSFVHSNDIHLHVIFACSCCCCPAVLSSGPHRRAVCIFVVVLCGFLCSTHPNILLHLSDHMLQQELHCFNVKQYLSLRKEGL